MTVTAPSATFAPPKPPHRQLAIAAAVAAIGHALLIWGLPRMQHDISGLKSAAMETRIIAAPLADKPNDSNFTPAEPMPPAPPPPPKPKTPPPPPKPPAPVPTPEPTPSPSPAAEPTDSPPPPPAEPQTSTPAPSPSTEAAAPSAPTSSLRSVADQPTLIGAIPITDFGGKAGAQPVRPMLTGNQTKTVLGQMAKAIEGQARLARASDLTYETRYTVGGEAIPGRTTLVWRHDKRYYQAKWVENNTKLGNDSYLSTGAVATQGLAPVTGNWDHALRETIQIDYGQQVANLKKSGEPVGSVPGVQDRISAVLHLGALMAGQPDRFAIGTRVQLPVLIDGRTENWSFTVQAQERMHALEQQDVPVVHLVYQSSAAPAGGSSQAPVAAPAAAPAPAASAPVATASSVQLGPVIQNSAPAAPGSIRQMDVWLGPTLDFLPVRLRIERFNGTVADHLLRTAVEQRVLSSLPPPADSLPGKPGEAPAAASSPASAPDSRPAFPSSGGG